MTKKVTRENIGKIINSVGLSILPAPIGAFLDAIGEINNEAELNNKFFELKKYADNIKKEISSMPISIEVELISVIIIYLDRQPNKEMLIELEHRLYEMRDELVFDGMVDDFILESNVVAVNLSVISTKDEVTEGIIDYVRGLLNDFELKIKAIAYF